MCAILSLLFARSQSTYRRAAHTNRRGGEQAGKASQYKLKERQPLHNLERVGNHVRNLQEQGRFSGGSTKLENQGLQAPKTAEIDPKENVVNILNHFVVFTMRVKGGLEDLERKIDSTKELNRTIEQATDTDYLRGLEDSLKLIKNHIRAKHTQEEPENRISY